ncbi:MAG: CO dehydrogenase/acetyl-CoA synthase complex subunit alpha [Candidatus Hodarchaeales archaeon]
MERFIMARKANVKIGSLKSAGLDIEGLDLRVGKILTDEIDEPRGPTPFPGIKDLRSWDMKLMNRYEPWYAPACDMCCLCTYGKCDLSENKKGACGLDLNGQTARIVTTACSIGCAAHLAHANHMVHSLSERFSPDLKLYLGKGVAVEAPLTRLITGRKLNTLGDMEEILEYCNRQLVDVLASIHTGQESTYRDFESKSLHIGMIDLLGMELADIAQVSAFKSFPKGDADAPLVDIGLAAADTNKPTILVIGHNVVPSTSIIDRMEELGLMDKIELGGICCTALDNTRYDPRTKIVGTISQQQRYIRSGRADLVVIDEQCIRADVVQEARKVGTPVISTTDKAFRGLRDRTGDPTNKIIDSILKGEEVGVGIYDYDKLGEVAVELVQRIAPMRMKDGVKKSVIPSLEELRNFAEACSGCRKCMQNCVNDLDIPSAIAAAAKGDMSELVSLYNHCVACGRCEENCSKNIPVLNLIIAAGSDNLKHQKSKVRSGRGAISDTEIRRVGSPIVFGEIPGIIAPVGCPNYPAGPNDLGKYAEEFLKRRYIVTVSGCSAMDIAHYRTEDGENLYEKYGGEFDGGGLVNVGSCVANAHIAGAAVKVANIFAKRPLSGNYEEIADYILNRLGAVGIAWGAYSQKAASIAAGVQRLGVPVIVGPHGWKYRRLYTGDRDNDEKWKVYDARSGDKMYVGPFPEHLMFVAETIDEAIVETARLCIRANDTFKGRAIKLVHYWELSKKYYGRTPPDIERFIREEKDIPISLKEDILPILENKGWEPRPIPDPTIVKRLIRQKK